MSAGRQKSVQWTRPTVLLYEAVPERPSRSASSSRPSADMVMMHNAQCDRFYRNVSHASVETWNSARAHAGLPPLAIAKQPWMRAKMEKFFTLQFPIWACALDGQSCALQRRLQLLRRRVHPAIEIESLGRDVRFVIALRGSVA